VDHSEVLCAIKNLNVEVDFSPIMAAISSMEVDMSPLQKAISRLEMMSDQKPVLEAIRRISIPDGQEIANAVLERMRKSNLLPDNMEFVKEIRKLRQPDLSPILQAINSAEVDFGPVQEEMRGIREANDALISLVDTEPLLAAIASLRSEVLGHTEVMNQIQWAQPPTMPIPTVQTIQAAPQPRFIVEQDCFDEVAMVPKQVTSQVVRQQSGPPAIQATVISETYRSTTPRQASYQPAVQAGEQCTAARLLAPAESGSISYGLRRAGMGPSFAGGAVPLDAATSLLPTASPARVLTSSAVAPAQAPATVAAVVTALRKETLPADPDDVTATHAEPEDATAASGGIAPDQV
jgi:hypothetical protein